MSSTTETTAAKRADEGTDAGESVTTAAATKKADAKAAADAGARRGRAWRAAEKEQRRAAEKAEAQQARDAKDAKVAAEKDEAKRERAAAKEAAKGEREEKRAAEKVEAERRKGEKAAERRTAAVMKLAGKIERPSACTDTANAERFAEMHRGRARFVPQWNMWVVYDGKRWAKDSSGVRVGKLAKDVARSVYGEAKRSEDPDERRELAEWATYSEAKKQREAMIVLARSEDGMSVDFTELDSHPDLFNVANGTLDLRKGELRPHNPADLLTKISPVKFDRDAKCERFERFLSEIMGGDEAMVEFLRRFHGYSLSGSTREHAMCFWYGALGGNGKSTLAVILFFVLGDYAIKAAPDLLFRSANSDRHPTELADLHGARLVICNETSAKRTWDESTVKDITGGDPIKARRMREDFWSFIPTHKLVVFGNAMPTIANTNDGGLKRRLRLVPFEVSFSGAPDKRLDVTLRREAPGILAVLVRGCLAWQKDGLTEPSTIADATADYFAEQDLVGRFVRERCDLNQLARMPRKALRLAIEEWAAEEGEECPSPKDVAKWLAKNDVTDCSVRDGGGVVHGWRGIRLRLEAKANGDARTGDREEAS